MTLSDLGPLDWRIAITDKNGRPTPEFQRRWNTQRDNNTKVPTNFVQLGDVPNSYTGDGLDVVRVKSTASGLEFVTLAAAMDAVGSTQGSIIYRSATGWTVLLPGTAGQALITGGSGANPSWGNGIPAGVQGDVLYYNGTAWVTLHAGASGQVLTTGGTGANPSWQTPSSGGGGSGSLPALRGYGHVCNSASSFTLALPAGTAANDVAIVFGESGWGITPATGFTQIYYNSAGTTSVGAWYKTVTSGDVTAGSYTFTTSGSFDAAFSIAVVQGPITATPNPKSYVAYHNPSGGDSTRTLTTSNTTYTTDLLIGWTGSRSNATLSQSGLTTKETYTDGGAACGILATGAGTTGGSTVNFNGMSGAGGYGSIVVVINGGGSPTPFGGGTAGQVWTSNGGTSPNWATSPGRPLLTGNLTLYVSTTGSDSNSGTSSLPFLTIQKAVSVAQSYDFNNYIITIQCAAGTYAGQITVSGLGVGQESASSIIIQGDTTTPSNCVLSFNTSGQDTITAQYGAAITVRGFKFTGSSARSFLFSFSNGVILFNNCEFGAVNSFHLYSVGTGSRTEATGNYTISGGASVHEYAQLGGYIRNVTSNTVTLVGTPAFSAKFAGATDHGIVEHYGTTYSGSATGIRYSVVIQSEIQTYTGNTSYFPGSSAGSVDATSVYV